MNQNNIKKTLSYFLLGTDGTRVIVINVHSHNQALSKAYLQNDTRLHQLVSKQIFLFFFDCMNNMRQIITNTHL